jgi:hypothetical protein
MAGFVSCCPSIVDISASALSALLTDSEPTLLPEVVRPWLEGRLIEVALEYCLGGEPEGSPSALRLRLSPWDKPESDASLPTKDTLLTEAPLLLLLLLVVAEAPSLLAAASLLAELMEVVVGLAGTNFDLLIMQATSNNVAVEECSLNTANRIRCLERSLELVEAEIRSPQNPLVRRKA